ncbi:MAG: DUF1015 family protein [Thermoplasmatota archaeon]
MVAVSPFRALRFSGTVDLGLCTSPPHDCIPARLREALLAGCPTSIVRIVLGDARAGDVEPPEKPNRFWRAGEDLKAWTAEGVMARDSKPAFYLYEVTHRIHGEPVTMRGLLARVRLDASYKEIRGHEAVVAAKKRDRLHLRQATQCDTEPIWLLYRDERGWVEEILTSNAGDELCRFTDEAGIEHRLWPVSRPEAVGEIVAQFDDRKLVIADGHHRYQTAVEHAAGSGRAEHQSILACLVRDNDPGIRIEATHRLVRLEGTQAEWMEQASRYWDVKAMERPPEKAWRDALEALRPGVVWVYTGELFALTLKESAKLDGGRGRLDTLSVTLAHDRLIAGAWNVEGHGISYTRDWRWALSEVDDGRFQAAVMLPPEEVSTVLEVAQEGHLMPAKATYFIPKVRSGVVLGPLDEKPPVGWVERAGGPGKPDVRLPSL